MCYDSYNIQKIAEDNYFSIGRVSQFNQHKVDCNGRVCLNGDYHLSKRVIIEVRKDHFAIIPQESRLISFLRRLNLTRF